MAQAPAPAHLPPEETLTGEAVALDVQPLGFFLRAVGALIDLVTAVLVLVVFLLLASWVSNTGALPAEVLPIVSIVVLVLVAVVLPTTVETVTRGRSLGRLVVGGRIVRSDGGASGFRQAFLRALAGVLEIWLTLGGLAAIVGAFTPRSQRLGDLLAGTYSERTRTRPLPPPAPGVPPVLESWARVVDVDRLPDRLAARIAQFLRQAPQLQPAARVRLAATLAEEARTHVSPVPAVDAETLLRGVSAVRREREWRALISQNERVAALLRGTRENLR
ncbi:MULTISPECIES: RDD family protein [unclassified Microbacterium]|uniref:RDD family protein n=1 Tax=unclassified Microbacterium TaxID=2609290 RepID=UPI0037467B15